jgi:hypothetical protein
VELQSIIVERLSERAFRVASSLILKTSVDFSAARI